ncbi:MAG: hypothetical protein SOZ43_06450 [Eubacteriales bacterium]|nr:hypothetical protein [Eubacteriales bacterium]
MTGVPVARDAGTERDSDGNSDSDSDGNSDSDSDGETPPAARTQNESTPRQKGCPVSGTAFLRFGVRAVHGASVLD